ncbi:MAG: bifunctional phosphopantothenoylcysteine decarboxylase/phosphopantothenate--cysteine ligase CoaBC [Candidatus Latescibacteria bacterium]|nr:bifunctional phosphopantothenoylcysteine decarboxylase/phosphopantothenate--cysteine ligase CoaBC [Candidatus Latescibacterota bacterium]
MMDLAGRNILLGVTGGIAAYKAPLIVRGLVAAGAQVRVVTTAAAQRFVAPGALETMSRHRVHDDLFATEAVFPVLHVGLAEWADLILVAPATANFIAKAAHGLADDLLSTLVLGRTGPALVAPAMETHMWTNPAVEANIQRLRQHGFGLVEPEEGELASGGWGPGRLPEAEELVAAAARQLAGPADLVGLDLLVTAGPTVEDIDPVRFISNRSTGKMGFAVALRAQQRGARVYLVTGPTPLAPPPGVEVDQVRSTLEMQAVVERRFGQVQAAVLAAAVADYRVREVASQKIKRSGADMRLELVENPDIAAALGRVKGDRTLVGFAMETEEGVERAGAKLRRKNLDFIVLNRLDEEGAGFAVDTNVGTLIDADGAIEVLPKMSKEDLADRILDCLRDLRGLS